MESPRIRDPHTMISRTTSRMILGVTGDGPSRPILSTDRPSMGIQMKRLVGRRMTAREARHSADLSGQGLYWSGLTGFGFSLVTFAVPRSCSQGKT